MDLQLQDKAIQRVPLLEFPVRRIYCVVLGDRITTGIANIGEITFTIDP
ncbi:hypothetical protein [Pseudomonas sp.]|jgi:hypothetical protein